MRSALSPKATVAAAALACLVLVACGGEDEPQSPAPPLAPAIAEVLASESEDVAEELEAGDFCGAEAELSGLQIAVAAARSETTPALRRELELAVRKLAARIECLPAPPPPPREELGHGEEWSNGYGHDRKHDEKDKPGKKDEHDDDDENGEDD